MRKDYATFVFPEPSPVTVTLRDPETRPERLLPAAPVGAEWYATMVENEIVADAVAYSRVLQPREWYVPELLGTKIEKPPTAYETYTQSRIINPEPGSPYWPMPKPSDYPIQWYDLDTLKIMKSNLFPRKTPSFVIEVYEDVTDNPHMKKGRDRNHWEVHVPKTKLSSTPGIDSVDTFAVVLHEIGHAIADQYRTPASVADIRLPGYYETSAEVRYTAEVEAWDMAEKMFHEARTRALETYDPTKKVKRALDLFSCARGPADLPKNP